MVASLLPPLLAELPTYALVLLGLFGVPSVVIGLNILGQLVSSEEVFGPVALDCLCDVLGGLSVGCGGWGVGVRAWTVKPDMDTYIDDMDWSCGSWGYKSVRVTRRNDRKEKQPMMNGTVIQA
jgi:hypothetical protein